MADTKAGEIKHDAAIETMVDYKRGLRNLDTGSKILSLQTGLDEDISALILKSMKRDNVTQIRGYSKEPDRLRKSKIGKSNEPKR
jgi:hypothetical protein|tara:strand:- start:500 stop:754 length:255 start_codon:yes stop_codon:yes gene_type:complete